MKQPSLFIGREISASSKSWLIAENIGFEEHPFIRIELRNPVLPVFSSVQKSAKQFVVSSQWAAKWLVKNKTEIGFEPNDSVVCLSEKQKVICSAVSHPVFVAEHQNASSLAQRVIEINRSEKVVYLHGNRSLNVFESHMKSAGIGIQKIEVYRNLPVLKRLSNSFGVYLFFSPGGAANFAESGNHIPDSASVVAIGETTAGICRKLFGREVFVSKYQDELAAVKFASGLLKTKEDLIPVII